MINDLDETIKRLLLEKGKLDSGEVEISFDQPTGEWSAGLTRPTINCYLYDIRENTELRSREWHIERQDGKVRQVVAPMRVDLSYLITVWTRNIEDEHKLLWRVLQVLAQHPRLEPEECYGALKSQPYPIPTKVGQPSEAIRNIPDLWGVMENQLRPAVHYVVTLALDTAEVIEGPPVLTARVEVGPSEQPESGGLALVDAELWHIGGRVLAGGKPVAGAEITVKEEGFTVRTDPEGRYRISRMPPGKYTLQIEAEGVRPQEMEIEVPSGRYDLELTTDDDHT